MVTTCSPRPMRAVQRARLCAITCTVSQAPFGGEAARRHVVQPDAVLEVAYRILDLGVAAMISLQFEHLPVAVGDEGVIAVSGEEGELGTGRRLHPPDNEPHRGGVGLGLERDVELVSEVFSRTNIVIKTASNYGRLLVGNTILSSLASIIRMSLWSWTSETSSVGGFRHIGGTVHPVGYGRPVRLGYRLDEIAQPLVLADGDGEAQVHLAADGYHAMSVEPAVGPHRELSAGPGVAHPSHRLTVSRRKWAVPRAVLARPSRSRDISTSPVPAAVASSG